MLSIIVGTKDRPTSYQRFKKSVEDTVFDAYEIIVGDASTGEQYTIETAAVKVLREDPPLGTLRGYNRCFRAAQGEWVCWFNDDVQLLPGWWESAKLFMEASPEVGLGAVYFRDRDQDGNYGPFRVYDFPGTRFTRRRIPFFIPGIPHANFGVLPRHLGDRLDWFDEEMGAIAYGCDTSLGLKVVDAGYAVVRIPNCKVIHHRAYDEGMNERLDTIRESDFEKFKAKWGARFEELQLKHEGFAHLVGPEVIE